MNKLLQIMMDLGDVSHRMMPGLPKAQDGATLPVWARPMPNGSDIGSLPGVKPRLVVSKEQLAKNKAAVEQRVKAENAQILAERRARLAAAEKAKSQPFSFQQLADETQASGDKFRLFPNDPHSFFDEWLNPGVMLGNFGSGLARTPLDVQQGNYGRALWDVASPALAGAAEAIVSPLINKAFSKGAGMVRKALPGKFTKGVVENAEANMPQPYREVVDPETGESKLIYELDMNAGRNTEPIQLHIDPNYQYNQSTFDQVKNGLKKFVKDNVDNSNNYEKVLSKPEYYEDWAHKIHPDLPFVASADEIKALHKEALDFFKGSKFVEPQKEIGMYIKHKLADRIPAFTKPTVLDEAGGIKYYDDHGVHPSLQEEVDRYNLANPSTEGPKVRHIPGVKYVDDGKWAIANNYNTANLTGKEMSAMQAYARGFDSYINHAVRGTGRTRGTEDFYKALHEDLNSGILKNKIEDAQVVRRGVGDDHDVQLLDPVTHKPTGKIVKRSELKVGDTFMDHSVLSTTRNPESEWGRRELSETIQLPGGRVQSYAYPNGTSFTPYPNEKELILPDKLVRQVVHVNDDVSNLGSTRYITKILNPHMLTAPMLGLAAYQMQKKRQGGPIIDPRGQWAHPGKVTRIPSDKVTMKKVPYPVYGVGSNGKSQMMYPDQEYDFGGAAYVDEYPMMQDGGEQDAFQKSFDEGRDWLIDWYKQRAANPQFTDVANKRIDFISKPAEIVTGKANKNILGGYMEKKDNFFRNLNSVDVDINPVLWAHENTHRASLNVPQNFSKDWWRTYSALGAGMKNAAKNFGLRPPAYEYVRRPSEMEAHLNQFRKDAKLDPNKQYTNEEMLNLMKPYMEFKIPDREHWTPDEDNKSAIRRLFNSYGNDPEKINLLNNSIVGNVPTGNTFIARDGGEMIRRADGHYSRRGLWDNIRANKGSGKKPTKEMLEQERKIKRMQDGGDTLMENKVVGKVVTPQRSLSLHPYYYQFKKKVEPVYDPECPDGVGCSRQASKFAQSITGLPYASYAPADAAYRDAMAEYKGLNNIFDQEGDQRVNADSQDKGWKYPTYEDFKKWKAGDIVTLDAGEDVYFKYGPPKGFTSKQNHGQSHNGVIYGFDINGRPIIRHGAATGSYKGTAITEVLGDDNRVSNLGHGRYAIKSVWRPKEVGDDDVINDIKYVRDSGADQARRKQNTTSNYSFSLDNPSEQQVINEAPVAAEFSGANNRLDTKKKLVDLFNNKDLDKKLQYQLGITAEELNKLKPVVYGVFGQESHFNDVDSPGASLKELIGNLVGSNSRGAAQIKMSSLTPAERKIIGVKHSRDLENTETSYKAALLLLNNARKRMNMEVSQGTHPELKDADEYFRAGYFYNSPARAISTAKKWAKGSNPSHWYNPLSWKNNLTTRQRPNVFGTVDPNYADKIELRMDKGSYPYKLMQQAADLKMNMDFSKPADLEEVVVRGVRPGKAKYIPTDQKKFGGTVKIRITN